MSQFFKNTFGKDDSQHNLQYDNTAFLFFIMSISFTLSILLVFLILKHLKNHQKLKRQYNLVLKDPLFNKKRQVFSKLLPSVFGSFSFIIKLVLLIIFVSISLVIYQQTEQSNTTLKGFDPYELLGVDFNTPIPQIKKAYRKLALELHPDRNSNNPQASSKFIFVSKAYECLTDETKKDKCLKYGNPDGSQSFNVGIALPSFLIQPQNQVYVMVFMFIVLLVVIPKLFLVWNNKFQTKDARGIVVANYYLLYRMFIYGLSPEAVLKTASQMKEVENLSDFSSIKNMTSIFNEELRKYQQEQDKNQKQLENKEHHHEHGENCQHNHEEEHHHQHQHQHGENCQHDHEEQHNHNHQNQKSRGHDHGHDGCCGEEEESEEEQMQAKFTQEGYNKWKKGLKPIPETSISSKNLIVLGAYIQKQISHHKILELMPDLLRSMVYFSLDFCTKSSKKKKSLFIDNPNLFFPYMGTPAYHILLKISKSFYQNAQGSAEGLQNLTLTCEEVANLSPEFSIRKLTQDQTIRKKFLDKFPQPERRQSLRRQIELMPAINMQVQTLAGDQVQTTFTARDVITFRFKITKNPTHGVAFVPKYGYLKRQKFYFSIEIKEELLYFQQVTFEPGQTEIIIEYSSYRSRDIIEQQFLALIRSDCYFGLDVGKKIPLKFIQYQGDDRIIFNKEDLNIQRIPMGYFESALNIELADPHENMLSDTADDDNGQMEDIPETNTNTSKRPQSHQQQEQQPAMEKIQ